MKNVMVLKGYYALVEFDGRDNLFFGRILGIDDIITFHGGNVSDLRTAFEESISDYLSTCKKHGKKPQKPYSGQLMFRVPPEVHAAVTIAAKASGKSLNQWATEVLKQASLEEKAA